MGKLLIPLIALFGLAYLGGKSVIDGISVSIESVAVKFSNFFTNTIAPVGSVVLNISNPSYVPLYIDEGYLYLTINNNQAAAIHITDSVMLPPNSITAITAQLYANSREVIVLVLELLDSGLAKAVILAGWLRIGQTYINFERYITIEELKSLA